MGIKVNKYGEDMGTNGTGGIHIATNVADGETFTIGNKTYEFDRAEDGVVAGNIPITGQADDTPAEATDAAIVAINANDTNVRAIDRGTDDILLVTRGVLADGPIDTSETMAGVGNVIRDVVGNGSIRWASIARVPSAEEIIVGEMWFAFPFTPATVIIQVRVTATGIVKAWDGGFTITAKSGQDPDLLILDNDGAVDWAATNTVHVFVQSAEG